jgi:predicted dehydrogenase
VVAVAARDPERAAAFAQRHGIGRVEASYADLVWAPDVDAVYIGLPVSHHAHWTLEALRAGKHVLCEKPFATSAGEASKMVDLAAQRGLVCCEAIHYYFHPLAARLRALCQAELGPLERLEGRFDAPIGDLDDIRYQLALGGGATMDLGCYVIHWMRTIVGEEPSVTRATAIERPAGVDEAMTAELRFSCGATARVDCDMSKGGGYRAELRVRGRDGELEVRNLLAPHFGHSLRWQTGAGEVRETVDGEGTTFDYQLEAFVAAVRGERPLATGGEDAIANARVLDAIYAAAGLAPRRGFGTTASA